jgi:hypothetical protein
MSSINISYNSIGATSIDVQLMASNSAPGRVVCEFRVQGSTFATYELGIGESLFVNSYVVSGLTPSTTYNFTSVQYGKTSGTVYATSSSSRTTLAPPPFFPFFPPFFPPSFGPFFPPFFPFFPPFFPPTFVPSPSWSDQTLSTTSVVEGTSYSDGVSATNASSYSVQTGSLPSGITLNTSTGAITGTPDQGTAGTYNFVIRATGSGGTIDTNTLTLTVVDDGGKVRVFNSSTSQWVEAPVRVYNSSTQEWVQADVYVYNSSTGTWQKSQ